MQRLVAFIVAILALSAFGIVRFCALYLQEVTFIRSTLLLAVASLLSSNHYNELTPYLILRSEVII